MNKPVTPQQSQAQSRVAELTAIAQKAQARPAIADVGIGAAKTAANFVEQGDVLGTMNRLAKGDTSDLNTNKIPNMIDAANPLKTMHSLSGDMKDWTGRDTSVTPSENPDWSGTSPAQRAQMEQPSNYNQKVGQSAAIVAANVLPIVAPGLKSAAGGLKEALTPKPPTPEETAMQQQKATEVASQERQAKIQKGGEAWEHPTKPGVATNPASFKNAGSILEKNPGVPTFLAQNKMHPNAFMENGRYDTADAAEGMREDAVKMSKEALRPALEAANPSVPVTHAPDVLTRAFQSLSQDKRLTPGDRIKVANNIMNEARALGNEHPNGMSLTDTFDKRIVYDKNSGYHAGKSLDDTNAAIANQHLGHAMRDIVNEKSAQAGLDTESFQDELSKYFRAADYLDALNTKKVPQSLVSKIANRAAAVMGAAAGHSFSGGILGGVGGYVIGGALEHMAENFVGKRGGEFLNNLEQTNPKAFEAVKEYIQKTQDERAGQMKLPPGAEKGTPANPHIVPPKETSGVEMVPAGKYPTSANPKTGRFQTMYHEGQGKLEPDGFDPKASGGGPKTPITKNPQAGFVNPQEIAKAMKKLYMGRGMEVRGIPAGLENVGLDNKPHKATVNAIAGAIFLSPDKSVAAKYGNVTEHSVHIQDPLILDNSKGYQGDIALYKFLNDHGIKNPLDPFVQNEGPEAVMKATEDFAKAIQDAGHDGVIIRVGREGSNLQKLFEDDQVAVFHKSQLIPIEARSMTPIKVTKSLNEILGNYDDTIGLRGTGGASEALNKIWEKGSIDTHEEARIVTREIDDQIGSGGIFWDRISDASFDARETRRLEKVVSDLRKIRTQLSSALKNP